MSQLFTNIRLAETNERKDLFIDNGTVSFQGKSAEETIHGDTLVAFPGLIDCHVHFREPGYEHKATIQSESQSAWHGGVTTVCEMPNTNPSATTVDAFADKVHRAASSPIDVRFFFGITERAHIDELIKLFTDDAYGDLKKRCSGVKIYFEHSTGNQKIDGSLIETVFQTCADLGITLVGHCEDSEIIAAASKKKAIDIGEHSRLRPPEAEAAAVLSAIDLAKKHGTNFHVAHLSTKQAAELVRQAKNDALSVTCEVAPHHLFLSTEDYVSLGTLTKMNPPVRSPEHLEALWQAVKDRTVDCIATDHAPHTLEEKKTGEPLKAPSGVPGVETMLPLLLSVANKKWPHPHLKNPGAELSFSDIHRLCFERPNEIFLLEKSGIQNGGVADLTIVDPELEWTIAAHELHSKCTWTPFEHWRVQGKVSQVIRGSR